jgi:predicted nucleic acid-binding protein
LGGDFHGGHASEDRAGYECRGIRRVAAELNEKYRSIEIKRILELLLVGSEVVVPAPLPRPICIDPDDDKFFDCAVAGDASVIVSGDKHLLKASGSYGINVVTPRQFIDKYLYI